VLISVVCEKKLRPAGVSVKNEWRLDLVQNWIQKVELQVDTDSPTTASTEYGLQIFGFYIYTT
jgi:hypothetical protein